MILTLARKSFRARLGRNLFILFAVAMGVSFVSGAFVLADSMRSTFDDLFDDLGDDFDFLVRPNVDVGDAAAQGGNAAVVPDGVPFEFLDEISSIDGVSSASGKYSQPIVVVDDDTIPLATGGAPMLGLAYPETLGEGSELEGSPPSGPTEAVIARSNADRFGYEIDSTIRVGTKTGLNELTISGILDESTDSGGAVLVFFDPVVAGDILGAPDQYDYIRVDLAGGSDADAVGAEIAEMLAPGFEVVTGQQVAEENKDDLGQIITVFSTGLLIFAVITAFVAAFIINNVLSITLGQRLRELALLRAVGASKGQIRALVLVESTLIAVLGTVLGVLGGVVVAKLIIALFNAFGAEFPDFGTVITLRTVIVSAIVGLGTVLVAALTPARRASRIPPVAAMRPELGFSALSASRRLVGATIATVFGIALFAIGIFVRPGGTNGIIALGGGGALLIFLGVSSLSTAIARPMSMLLGAPVAAVAGVAGGFARQNAARSPRRTARTASALMIGVAIISTAATFAESTKADFNRALNTGVIADFFVEDTTFTLGIPDEATARIAALPEVESVHPLVRSNPIVNPDGVNAETDLLGIDPTTFSGVMGLDPIAGSYDQIAEGGIGLFKANAEEWDVSVGDQITLQAAGTTRELKVGMIFSNNAFGPISLVSNAVFAELAPDADDPMMVLVETKPGVDNDEAKTALESLTDTYVQLRISTAAEQRASIVAQIDQLIYMITGLMSFAFALAFFGIAVTLAMSVLERTREIGLLRAVGMTRRQLRRAIRWESVIVAIFGVLIGAVVGIGIAIALLTALPEGYIDIIAIPWGTLGSAALLAMIFALVAASYPALKASHMKVLDALSAQ